MEIVNELVKAVTVTSRSETRSKQTAIGPSQVGGCRKQLWLQLSGAERTNQTLKFPSMFGTAIHGYILQAFKNLDPFGERYLLEQEWADEATGIVGHIDCYDKETKQVIDWKSTKKNNLRYFPSKQQRWQVQLYGYLLKVNGHEVENVTLVAIPRDGDERDIVYHTEPWSMEIVTEALAWLNGVKSAQYAPAPEKDPTLCSGYCSFYDATGKKGCAGLPKVTSDSPLIEDNGIDTVAQEYLEINKKISELEEQKDSIKQVLVGINGRTPSGLTISWSQVAGRKTIDEEIVREKLGEVPYKVGKSSDRLTVK
jgi:PD-(D/E)XK nuclease superfamily